MTTSVDEKLSLGESIFRDLVWDNLVTTGLASLFASNPWLAIWPISLIITALVHMFSDKMFSAVSMVVDVNAIGLINGAHQTAFNQAALKLAVLAHDKGVTSDEFKTQRDIARAALAQFVHYT